MSLYALVISVFVLVAGAVVGVAMLLVSRARAQQAQAISNRLQEFGGAAAQADGAGSLLAASAGGPLPNVDRAARLAIKGSGFERWLEQTGTKMSLTTCFLMAVALAT